MTTELILYLTQKCNLDCVMCDSLYKGANVSSKELDIQTIREILKNYSPKSITLFGGEPMLHSDFAEVLRLVRKNTPYIYLATNGIYISKYLGEVLDCVDAVGISIDSHREEVHDSIRKKRGAFRETVAGLSDILKKRHEGRPLIQCVCVISKQNYHELSEMCRWGEKIGIDIMAFNFPRFFKSEPQRLHETPYTKKVSGDYFEIDPERLHHSLEEVTKFGYSVVYGPRGAEAISHFFSNETAPPGLSCGAHQAVGVFPSGDVVLCADFPTTVVGKAQDSRLWGNLGQMSLGSLKKNSHFPFCKSCLKYYEPYGPGVARWSTLLKERYPSLYSYLAVT